MNYNYDGGYNDDNGRCIGYIILSHNTLVALLRLF